MLWLLWLANRSDANCCRFIVVLAFCRFKNLTKLAILFAARFCSDQILLSRRFDGSSVAAVLCQFNFDSSSATHRVSSIHLRELALDFWRIHTHTRYGMTLVLTADHKYDSDRIGSRANVNNSKCNKHKNFNRFVNENCLMTKWFSLAAVRIEHENAVNLKII